MFIHGVVGGVLLVSAMLALSELLERSESNNTRFRLPGSLCVGGLIVLLYAGVHHVGHDATEPENVDAAHWAIGVALVLGGVVVGLGRRRAVTHQLHEAAAPAANVVVGALFLVHGGGNSTELLLHVCVAAALVVSALAHMAVVLTSDEARSLRVFSVLLFAVGGMLLILYDAGQPTTKPSAGERHRVED